MEIVLIERIMTLHKLYLSGQIPGPPHHEVNPGLPKGSRRNFLYFTLSVCLNFQRNSAALWKSALATYEDLETRYLFDPYKVVQTSTDILRSHLVRHRMALQPQKHTDIWKRISQTFADDYQSDPRVFLQKYDWDVTAIIPALRVTEKAKFPYLSGLKLSNYWLFILSCYTDAQFRNMHQLSVIPDTHVVQSSIRLGIVTPDATPAQVEAVWRPLLQKSGIPPAEMHSALWRWSRNNFEPKV